MIGAYNAIYRYGTGLGGLSWEDVKAVIGPILDGRVLVVHPIQEEKA